MFSAINVYGALSVIFLHRKTVQTSETMFKQFFSTGNFVSENQQKKLKR